MSAITSDVRAIVDRLQSREATDTDIDRLAQLLLQLSERVDGIAETNNLWDGS